MVEVEVNPTLSQKRRAVVRRESAETQDYTNKPLMKSENLEELAYATSATDEPRWDIHMCDNRCRDKDILFQKLAAVVTDEGGSPHTMNLCRNCFSKIFMEQKKAKVIRSQWEDVRAEKSFKR